MWGFFAGSARKNCSKEQLFFERVETAEISGDAGGMQAPQGGEVMGHESWVMSHE
jgi:hypothetical protein